MPQFGGWRDLKYSTMRNDAKVTHSQDRGRVSVASAPKTRQRGIVETWTRSTQSLSVAIARLRHFIHSRLELVSMLLLAIYVPVLVLQVMANAQMVSMTSPTVVERNLGDPERGLERIAAENFTTIEHLDALAEDSETSDILRLVYTHTPLILRHSDVFPARFNTPIGLYYDVTQSTSGPATATTIRYFLWFVDEAGGMPIESRLAKFGHSMDRELVYRVTLLGDEVVGAYFQAPGHNHVSFEYDGETRPVFTMASANNNFRRVFDLELVLWGHGLLVPLPRYETINAPAHDPDFAALAAREVWEKYQIDLRNYVFVELALPAQGAAATISVRIDDRWYYLHEQIGGGVRRPGYNQVGVNVGYSVLPGDISEVRVIAFSEQESSLDLLRVSIYPRSSVAA
ncbi:hypothetical protein BH24CHL1_BH24CHL1_18520 [soil metagenome]